MDMNASGSSSQPNSYLWKRQFFKIVLEDGIIELPEEFVKEYGKELSRHVLLKGAKGSAQHQVAVRRSKGRIWLHKGWQQFMDYYSIKYADFLVFKYQGGSSFRVIIFDKSCSEITYLDASDDDDDNEKEEEEEISADEPPMATQSRGKFDEAMARERVVERAKAFESPNPHFYAIMRPAYLTRYFLSIPLCEVKSFFYGRENKRIRVNGPDGRAELMSYYIIDAPLNQVRITAGWKKFVDNYGLKDGDVCVFEMEFNVTIFRVSQQEDEEEEEEEE